MMEQLGTGVMYVRRHRRTRSSPASTTGISLLNCTSLPPTIDVLKLSEAPSTHTLASLRILVLAYLADLDRHLTRFGSAGLDPWIPKGGLTIDNALHWASAAIDVLKGIRADVYLHLPEIQLASLSPIESFVNMPGMTKLRSHLPDVDEVRLLSPDFTVWNVRRAVETHTGGLDFWQLLCFTLFLSHRLHHLRTHLLSLELFASLTQPNGALADLLDTPLSSELSIDTLTTTTTTINFAKEADATVEAETSLALKHSLAGQRLIQYVDLPQPWKSNPFITSGYRFIPLERWPLLIMSVFEFHNETLNILTHLIPAVLWGLSLVLPFFDLPNHYQTPDTLFVCFAVLCLACSAITHTMTGCAHRQSMVTCSRADYVGIGWLINASVGTLAHYGFQCYPVIGYMFHVLCLVNGVAGSILPFMKWFNQYQYRYYRVTFFLMMAFSGLGPIIGIALIHGFQDMRTFINPMIPSFLSYLTGLAFYTAHFPERNLPSKIQQQLNRIGFGSHFIWHCFVVIAISQHKNAIYMMRGGLQCLAP